MPSEAQQHWIRYAAICVAAGYGSLFVYRRAVPAARCARCALPRLSAPARLLRRPLAPPFSLPPRTSDARRGQSSRRASTTLLLDPAAALPATRAHFMRAPPPPPPPPPPPHPTPPPPPARRSLPCRHSRLSGSRDLEEWAARGLGAVRGAWREHVVTPLAGLKDELFNTFRRWVTGVWYVEGMCVYVGVCLYVRGGPAAEASRVQPQQERWSSLPA
jgi:hypothetical protein